MSREISVVPRKMRAFKCLIHAADIESKMDININMLFSFSFLTQAA